MTNILFFHILSFAVWIGAACTLPFWGNRMNRADHLHTVLGIIDTVFIIKCVFIMGGLFATIITGLMLSSTYGFNLLPWRNDGWLMFSEYIALLIFINSWIIFFYLFYGRKGHRTLMRKVPAIGYTNIFLIALVAYLMTAKPSGITLYSVTGTWLGIILLANLINIIIKINIKSKLTKMPGEQYANNYFGLLNAEKMTDMLKLFHDDIVFKDPFATATIKGIIPLEKFFQKLGDQFDTIKIEPVTIREEGEDIHIEWVAAGLTKNGERLENLRGTNKMTRVNGKIKQVLIDFNIKDLPKLQLVTI